MNSKPLKELVCNSASWALQNAEFQTKLSNPFRLIQTRIRIHACSEYLFHYWKVKITHFLLRLINMCTRSGQGFAVGTLHRQVTSRVSALPTA